MLSCGEFMGTKEEDVTRDHTITGFVVFGESYAEATLLLARDFVITA